MPRQTHKKNEKAHIDSNKLKEGAKIKEKEDFKEMQREITQKNEEIKQENAPHLEPIKDRAKILGVVIILALALIAMLWYGGSIWNLGPNGSQYNKANNTTAISNESKSALETKEAALMLQTLGKISSIPKIYSAEMIENDGGDERIIKIKDNGSVREISILTKIYNRTYIFDEKNKTILCEQPIGEQAYCAVLNETYNPATISRLQSKFLPSKEDAKNITENYRLLIGKEGFKFSKPAGNMNFCGRSCQSFSYQFGSAEIEICLDEEYGFTLYENMSYNKLMQTADGKLFYTRANYSIAFSNISFENPAIELADEYKDEYFIYGLVGGDDEKLSALQECLHQENEKEVNRCLKESAISYNKAIFCEVIENESARGDCIIKLATQPKSLKPEICPKAGAMKSECYANIAFLKKDISYCNLVEDENLKAECLKTVGG